MMVIAIIVTVLIASCVLVMILSPEAPHDDENQMN